MDRLRYYLALWAAKLSIIALKITKHNATNFPGIVALKVCPAFLKYAKKPRKIIGITGTNGKTTCSNMVTDVLRMDGKNVLNNSAGSNINTGIATALIYGMTFFGKEKHDIAVLEIDERSAKRIIPFVKPEIMLVTNLSRDSIMRNAHPEYIADFLTDNIPKETKLVLNADDLISSSICPENPRTYYGIERMEGDDDECHELINDYQICPKCHHKLRYEYHRYNNIGKAYCPECGFKAPDYVYAGFGVDLDNMRLGIREGSQTADYKLLNDGVHNIYNQVAVISLLRELGYEHERLTEIFEKMKIVETRFSEEIYGDKYLYRLLAKEKNAFATSRSFSYISTQPGDKEIILMNSCQGDMKHWSENTCWLYDCDFEYLNDESIKNIILCGPRRFDHKLRLLLAGVPEDRISFSEKEIDAPSKLRLFKDDHIYVLYGTDSFALGMKVADMTGEILKGGAAS